MTETLEAPATAELETLPPSPNETALVPMPSPAIAAMQAIKFPRIPGDQINKATAEMADRPRALARWFAGYCRQKNLGQEEIASLLKKENGGTYSWHSVYQLWTGRRADQGVGTDAIIDAIEKFQKQIEGVRRTGDSGFVQTRMYAEIVRRCRRALERRRIFFLFGDSQIGKTECLREYQTSHNHGETIFLSVPVPVSLLSFFEHMAQQLDIPSQQRRDDLRRRIIESFDKRMLLIVDEAHLLLNGRGHGGLAVLDFLRELYNRAGCGMALAFTYEGKHALLHGTHAKRLEQLWRRRIEPLNLPRVVPSDDLALFAVANGLPPADDKPVKIRVRSIDLHGREREHEVCKVPLDLQTEVIASEGLGVWLMILQDARDMAREAKKEMSWGAVIRAWGKSSKDEEAWG